MKVSLLFLIILSSFSILAAAQESELDYICSWISALGLTFEFCNDDDPGCCFVTQSNCSDQICDDRTCDCYGTEATFMTDDDTCFEATTCE